jgi:hypothetical protein
LVDFFLFPTPVVEDVSGIANASDVVLYVDARWSILGGLRLLAPGQGCVCDMTLRANVLSSIDLGLLYYGPLHQVVEVSVHRLFLRLIRLGDRSEHHGRRNHVLLGVEEVLRAITTLNDLIANLPHLGPFGFDASLNVVVNTVEPLNE